MSAQPKHKETIETLEAQLLDTIELMEATIKARTGDNSKVLQATLRHFESLALKHDILSNKRRNTNEHHTRK